MTQLLHFYCKHFTFWSKFIFHLFQNWNNSQSKGNSRCPEQMRKVNCTLPETTLIHVHSTSIKGIDRQVSGESSACLPPMLPGFKFWHQRHIWVQFVVGSLLSPRGFSPGTHSCFSFSPKTTISKFQFDQESGRRRTTFWMCYLQIIIIIIIIIIIFIISNYLEL